MIYISEQYIDTEELKEQYELMEKARTKMIKSTRQHQLNRAGGRAAMRLAKERDPMYKRYLFHRKKYLDLKEKLMKKYSRRGMRAARSTLM